MGECQDQDVSEEGEEMKRIVLIAILVSMLFANVACLPIPVMIAGAAAGGALGYKVGKDGFGKKEEKKDDKGNKNSQEKHVTK